MKHKTFNLIKRGISLILIFAMLFTQSAIMTSFADETFTASQDGTALRWWYGKATEEGDEWRYATAQAIHVNGGGYNNVLAYCIQNMKNGPHGDEYMGYNPWATYYEDMAEGFRAILEYGYPNVQRPFGTQSDDEAYFATTQAFRFWVAEMGSHYNYYYSDLSGYSDSQLRMYARQGEFPGLLQSLNSQGDRAMIAAVELLIKARHGEGTKPQFGVSSETVSASPVNTNGNTDAAGNPIIDKGDYFLASVDVDAGNTSRWVLMTNTLPLGTRIIGPDGTEVKVIGGTGKTTALLGTTSGTIKFLIPYITEIEEAHTDQMTFTVQIAFAAKGVINPHNVILAAPAEEETDVSVQRLVFLDDEESVVGSKSVKIVTGTTIPDPGHLHITKIDGHSGAKIVGAGFNYYDANNLDVDNPINTEVLYTNENGELDITYIAPGEYVLAEVFVPTGYDTEKPYLGRFIIQSNQTTNVVAENNPLVGDSPKGVINVQKQDSVTGNTARGSASLAGGIFEVYVAEDITYIEKGNRKTIVADSLVDTIYASEATSSSKPLPYGDYYVKEIGAPKGYLVNSSRQNITLSGPSVTTTIRDNVVQNKIDINKTKGTRLSNTPESGINFKVTRVRVVGDDDGNTVFNPGSLYNRAVIAERYESITITTDDTGYASTGNLPYGVYYVEQLNSTSGYEKVRPFFVTLKSTTASYTYNLLDIPEDTVDYGARIQITKKDAETSEIIKNNSACFTITASNGTSLVNSDGTTHWCTNADGIVITGTLGMDTYTIKEVSAPSGYTLSSETKTVVINTSHVIDGSVPVINVDYENTTVPPVLGQINITKVGEVIGTGSTTSEASYYDENGNLKKVDVTTPGITYENLAGAQIVVKTLQAITWNGKDYAVNDTIADFESTTEVKVLEDLPLGQYTVQEIKAPRGYILDSTVNTITLTKGETDAAVVLSSVSITNNRPVTEFEVIKSIETLDIDIPDGYFAFGVYSEDDTLVGIVTNGKNSLKIPDGNYYVKELGLTQTAVDADYVNYTMLLNTEVLERFTLDLGTAVDGKVSINPIECVNKLAIYEVELSKVEQVGETKIKLGGATFVVKNVSGETVFTGDTKDGESIKVNLKPGTYTLEETKAPDGYVLNTTPVTFTVAVGGAVTGDREIVNTPISFKLRKTDDEGNGLPDAKFEIFKADGTSVLVTEATDGDGYVTISKLPVGTYYFTEKEAPEGYALSSQRYDFTVKADGTTEGTLTMVDYQTKIEITKVDNKDQPLPDAVFEVYGEVDGEFTNHVATVTSDVNGKASVVSLSAGRYKIVETKAPDGYALSTKTSIVTLNTDGTVTGTLKFINIPIEGSLTKTDLVTGRPVSGAQVKIWKEGTEEPANANYVTDVSGLISIKNLPAGTYNYKETKAPEGYMLLDRTYQFTIGTDGTFSGDLTFTNAPTEVVLHKRDLTGGTPVPGAKIVIYNNSGEVYYEGNTDADGDITLTHIPVGKYTFKETVAPDGYILNETVYTFDVREDGTVSGTTTITNEKTKVTLIKTGVDDAKLKDVKFELSDETGKLGEYTTNENGEIVFAGLLIGHRYTVTEISTVNGYALPEIATNFELDETGNIVGLNSKTLTISNKQIAVTLEKTSESGTFLEGAEFRVYKDDDTYDQTFTTNGQGKITIVGIQPGKYKLTETKAPSGYVLNSAVYEFEIDVYGNVSGTTRIVNSEITTPPVNPTYNVTLLKVSTTGENLVGAEFKITGTEYEKTLTSNADGKIELKGLKPGTYKAQETKAPTGYKLNSNVYEFTIDNAGNVSGTVKYENEKIPEEPTPDKKYDVTILKTNESGTALANAEFQVTNETLGYDKKFTSNSEGKITLKDLKPGTYRIKETKAPSGYDLNSNTYEFTVAEDGNVTGTTTIVNKKTPAPYVPSDPRPSTPTYNVTIEKVDEDGKPMQGVKFTFYRSNGNKMYTKTTDKNGKITLSGLTRGTYTYEEIETLEGYILPTEKFEFTIGSGGKVTGTTKVINYKEAPSIVTLSKRDSSTGAYLADCHLLLMDENGKEIKILVTDNSGKAVIEGLEPGNYTFREVKAPAGYAIDKSTYSFRLDKNNNITGTVDISDEKTEINIYKVDNEDQPLVDAVFGLFLTNSETPAYTTSSNTDGKAVFVGVVPGTYVLKEIKAPEGYEMSEETHVVTVTDTWENTDDRFVFVNFKIEEFEEPDISEANIPQDTPKTNDESPILRLSMIIALSTLGVGCLLILIAKEEKKEREE